MLNIPIQENLLSSVKGFLDPSEGETLYRLALDAAKREPCLEIGGYCGKSTLYLGAACKQNDQILFSVDHHQGSEEQQPGEAYYDSDLYDDKLQRINTFRAFQETLSQAHLDETVVAMVCRSDMAARYWQTPLSLIFIDGGHSREAVLTDYRMWSPHLIQGGYLLVHDIFTDPAQGGQAPLEIYRMALRSDEYHSLPMNKTLGILQKKT